jgi:hypothetical protein
MHATRPISWIDYHAFAINALLWIKEVKYGLLNNTEKQLKAEKDQTNLQKLARRYTM